jgi:hypothetical protein
MFGIFFNFFSYNVRYAFVKMLDQSWCNTQFARVLITTFGRGTIDFVLRLLFSLTPKGLNVRTANKPVLVGVTWAHTIFGFFETFCEHASRTKLRGKKKSYFLDLQIKSYWYLKFQGEVWAWRACAGANQQELTTCTKSGGQEEKTFQEKWELPQRFRRRPAASGPAGYRRPAVRAQSRPGDRAPTAGRRPKVGGPGPAGDQRLPAGHESIPAPAGQFKFFWNFFI